MTRRLSKGVLAVAVRPPFRQHGFAEQRLAWRLHFRENSAVSRSIRFRVRSARYSLVTRPPATPNQLNSLHVQRVRIRYILFRKARFGLGNLAGVLCPWTSLKTGAEVGFVDCMGQRL